MDTLADLLATGLKQHQSGNLEEAEKHYAAILAQDPDDADALHLMGLIAYQRGQHDSARELLEKAIRLNPNNALYQNHLGVVFLEKGLLNEAATCFKKSIALAPNFALAYYNFGQVLQKQDQAEEAIQQYQQAIQQNPNLPEPYTNWGILLQAQGKWQEAAACHQEAIRLNPNFMPAYNNLGNCYRSLSRFTEAISALEKALQLNPNIPEPYNNLGNLYDTLGQVEKAIDYYQQAIRINPNYTEAYNNLGNAFILRREFDKAIECLEKALLLAPTLPEVHYNLGNAFQELERLEEALGCFQKALAQNPTMSEAHNNVGNIYNDLGQFDEALVCYEKSLDIKPENSKAHWNRALLWLLLGNYPEGFAEYEWRFQHQAYPKRTFTQPKWQGEDLTGKRILVVAEQGMGDTLNFVRYLPMLKAQGATVIFECQPKLMKLLAQCPGIDELVPGDPTNPEYTPPHDYYSYLMSLPLRFQTTVESIPPFEPWIQLDEEVLDRWKEAVGQDGNFKIGIAWFGNPESVYNKKRSCLPAFFTKLSQRPEVSCYSLQKETTPEYALDTAPGLEIIDLTADLHDFTETAALIQQLDLVISVDTSITHIAATLEKPTWLILPFIADWRWLLGREDSPWYPTVRLFRQSKPDDWAPVFEAVNQALDHYLAQCLTTGA